ncbi:family 78 glycoside hydrolase catalytic domain [Flammeovirga sp. OC4]|uniref:family 78 glycoside hydrolase catalytic domain n=1 Tax=Flammeovirga sp. OC4 TaxID=1382345 RepID=UPI000A460AF2|nr:family 78 glycoside hydrolase catalytic domain [Flammeovirga sp. OC4]
MKVDNENITLVLLELVSPAHDFSHGARYLQDFCAPKTFPLSKMNYLLHIFLLQFLISIGITVQASENLLPAPVALTNAEGFVNPLGFYDDTPSFSWKIPPSSNTKKQKAYTIVVASKPELLPDKADLWTSGKVDSDQSIDISYGGEALKSRQKIYWQVRYWNEDDYSSDWSEVATVEMGLLSNQDWKAEWIKIPDPKEWERTEYGTPLFRPQYLRKEFEVNAEIKKARLYITAKGIFEANINGEKVGNDVLTPGWTPYAKRIETITYDIKEYLQEGENAIGITLAEGWFAGRFGPKRRWDTVNVAPSVICQLEIEDQNGKKQWIVSDQHWKASRQGPLRISGLYDGEVFDANFVIPGWNQPNFDDAEWEKVTTESIDPNIELSPKKHLPIRNKMELHPISMTPMVKNKVLFDFGQNMVGVVQLKIPVKKGDYIQLRHGEMLDQEGELFTKNLGSAKAIDHYIAKENDTICWRPKFTFHGFRYVEISGFDEEFYPEESWVKGIVQYSDFEMSGTFYSSNNKLNQLHSNIQWGLKGNFFDIPLDCPQRSERLGWTGDAQVFIPTSLFLSNTHAFWSAWLSSMREEQFDNGGVPVVVPNFTGDFAQAGWSDACTIVPWELYYRTGDTKVLKENYEMMQKWCAYHTSESTDHISHMSTVGDWLQPYSQQKDDRRGDTPNTLISTAYYAYSVKLTMQTAGVLGLEKDRLKYKKLLDAISVAFEREYFNVNGEIKSPYTPTQTGYLLALGFDILSEEMTRKAIEHLVELLKSTDNHLRTGFIGTPLLAYVLDQSDNTELLYEILFKETYPSWFYSINQGATTMWERWDGYTHDKGFANRALSFNHYAYGAIGQWMYERIAGIAPLEAGYKKILFAPTFNDQLTEAKGEYDSRYGKITSSWKYIGDDISYEITIPPNTTAKLVLPKKGKRSSRLIINGDKVKATLLNDQLILDDLSSGDYTILWKN